jgi:hypothetical protein
MKDENKQLVLDENGKTDPYRRCHVDCLEKFAMIHIRIRMRGGTGRSRGLARSASSKQRDPERII